MQSFITWHEKQTCEWKISDKVYPYVKGHERPNPPTQQTAASWTKLNASCKKLTNSQNDIPKTNIYIHNVNF